MYLRIGIASEHYALPIECVREVDRRGEVTPVPGAPPLVLGLRTLRGEVIPVLDVARALGAGHGGGAEFVVVVSVGARVAALAVDAVAGVEALEQVEPADDELLAGRVMADGELVGVLAVERLLAVEDGSAAA